jgi:SAM-dependent methyltransferase
MTILYDKIGVNYASLRRPDPGILQRIDRALGNARTVLNVGAGTGSYEPSGRQITAVEPSFTMIAQRRQSDAVVIQARAEDLPFDDRSFDASMAVLTVHHWADQPKGIEEMRRVTRDRIAILTFDPSFRGFWLTDYFPALVTLDEGQMPDMSTFQAWLGPIDVSVVPIPHDCTDGFLAAYWRRPAAYLDARVRAAISSFWSLDEVSDGLRRLDADIRSGAWEQRYSQLLDREVLDCGYRLIEARGLTE